MANASQVFINLVATGDVVLQPSFPTALNVAAPNSMPIVTLVPGDNQFSVPPGAQGLIVELPPANANQVRFRDLVGDTGYRMALTDPAYFPLAAAVVTIWLNNGGATNIAGVRLIWR